MRELAIITVCLILIHVTLVYAEAPQPLSLDQIYQEIIAPLQHENYQLKLQLMSMRELNQTLEKRLADLLNAEKTR
jgi:hypothetical protein